MMRFMKKRVQTVVATYLLSLLLMVIQKPIFLLCYADKAAGATLAECLSVIWHGLVLDSTTAGYLTVVPWLVMLLTIWINLSERTVQRVLKWYYIIITFVVSLVVSVDMGLFRYWDFRLDSTILQYIVTPKEAAASVTAMDVISTSLLFVAYAATMWFTLRVIYRRYRATIIATSRRVLCTLGFLLIGGLTFLAIRGGVGHAVANVSMVYFSDNSFLNQAATNPVFSFLSSSLRSELDADDYHYFDESQRQQIISSLYADPSLVAPCDSLLTTERPDIVLVILESFGRNVTDEKVDGEWVTPNIQALKQEGVWFENIIASSFRTDRGQVSVMSGWPAHPVASIMKYPLKARSLPSIAAELKLEGYTTSFTYGGDANFTNTASYLYNTGIETIYDEKNISLDSEHRTTQWGYNDAAMCDYFADQVLDLSQRESPFFASMLTLSSHEPFEVPHNAFDNKILNATHFTDEALGKMITKWKASPAWKDMLVVMIADHGMGYPEDLPLGALARQRIPMLWTGGAVREPRIINTYGSQSDMAATLLAQMGIAYKANPFSKNLLDAAQPHFGFWTYNNALGIIDAEGYVIFDCTGNRIMEQQGDVSHTEALLQGGKAILQTIHTDLCNK